MPEWCKNTLVNAIRGKRRHSPMPLENRWMAVMRRFFPSVLPIQSGESWLRSCHANRRRLKAGMQKEKLFRLTPHPGKPRQGRPCPSWSITRRRGLISTVPPAPHFGRSHTGSFVSQDMLGESAALVRPSVELR